MAPKKKKDRSLTEALSESGEPFIDAFATLPVLGPAIGLLKAKDSISDHILRAKIEKFLCNIGDPSPEHTERMRSRLGDERQATRIGEALLLTLDRLTALDKAAMAGRVFAAFVDGEIEEDALRRLVRAIDITHLDDLLALLVAPSSNDVVLAPVLPRLLGTGLTDPDAVAAFGGGGLSHRTSELGDTARKILRAWALSECDS
jgi:hypothetical protein